VAKIVFLLTSGRQAASVLCLHLEKNELSSCAPILYIRICPLPPHSFFKLCDIFDLVLIIFILFFQVGVRRLRVKAVER